MKTGGFRSSKRLRSRIPESVYTLALDRRRLRGSPSQVGRGIANPVRSALGGSNRPPRAVAMRVRTSDEIDPLAAFRLSVLSFGSAWDEAKVRRVRAHDRTYLEEFALYAEERGRVLAQVVPRRLAVRTTNGVEEVGGLAAVCSHPGVWGRGFARRLIEATHDLFRELGLSVSALTTSRNIRGYGVDAKLRYVDLAPFQQAIPPGTPRMAPKGDGLPAVRRSGMSTIHRLYRTQTRRMLGWTQRPEPALE